MPEFTNIGLLAGEALFYFVAMTALFRMRHRFGIGIFYCALGTMHFLETYLAAILYVKLAPGIVVSPGSTVLFAGKLLMLLLVYIREDAAAVRQPIFGLLFGNALMVGLVFLMRFHIDQPTLPGKTADFGFMDQMGWLMVWGTFLLFIDSIVIVVLYERLGSWLSSPTLRMVLSAVVVLSFDQVGFFAVLRLFLGMPYGVFFGGWVVKMVTGTGFALLTGAYLRFVEPGQAVRNRPSTIGHLFDALTYRQRYEALLKQAGRDSLTGLLNRGTFDRDAGETVQQAVAAGRPASVLVIDLDHFKTVNDRYGHTVGDVVLRQIARQIGAGIRGSDRVYRYGGEEFVVVCAGVAHEQAMATAERLRERIAATVIADLDGTITASIGVATSPDDGSDISELFGVADGRLYGAKESGRNCVRGRLGGLVHSDWPDRRQLA